MRRLRKRSIYEPLKEVSEEKNHGRYDPLVHGPDWALYEEKNALRVQARARLAALDPAEHRERSRQLLARLREMPALRFARRALLFAPLPSEPDIDLLWTLGAVADKQCAYPRVEGMGMRLYYVRGLAELEPTRWGLREPPQLAAREADIGDFQVVLVPGLAFDPAGRRLGRGGGFYDRLLERRGQRTTVIGCCFAFQRAVEMLPTAPHDVRMDFVCTDEGLIV